MSTSFEVPQSVLDNQRRRARANDQTQPCGEGIGGGLTCRAYPAHLHPCGWRCDEHLPQPVNPTPDPVRTLAGLRAAADLAAAPPPPATVATLTPPAPTVTDRFRAFHQQNPHVMQRLTELVDEHVSCGARRLGIGALFEELRGDVETNGNRYRLDNTLRADYVRALIADHPDWAGLFETRQRRSA